MKNEKTHSPFMGNIWGAVLADIQLISQFNKGILFFFCYLLLIFSINTHGLFLLKNKKGSTITSAFQKNLRCILTQSKQNMGR